MMRRQPGAAGLLVFTVVAAALAGGTASAATCEKWAGKVVSAQGVVEVKLAGETRWAPVKLDEPYCPGDTIRTDRRSRADIALSTHPLLRLDQNSTVTLGGMKDERTSLVDMLGGAVLFFSRVTRSLDVKTASVNAGVEGTEFLLRVEQGRTDLTVFEGKVLASNAAGGLAVTTGQSAVTETGKAPVYRTVVRPRDAVQWALYYPPVLAAAPAGLKQDDPRALAARAAQALAVGRVEEAAADLDQALKADPKNADALALQAVVAVTQNDKAKALELAGKAVDAGPTSAAARIALSYAQQARFDLEAAFASVKHAVELEPGNALAWARLAELQASFGDLGVSLASATKAVAANPDLSRTQTVLGFAYLTSVKTAKAAATFEKAIQLDNADPLPRLGLGLSRIRDGRLEEGRRDLEIAMSLDADNALIRSYLGKAYYEEKRDKLAAGQYEMAKSLDPSDPTPYFYGAIQKQTENRPVEALAEMEKAVELNDNRAVYRSRLLLDGDHAARSASIGRIYNDLGFQRRALVEGWQSVNLDPANYSAHRLQADLDAALPRREIARVSELLQSQLLQPVNITPVQPRLAESSLLSVSTGGPSELSFNEFNPLFERNRLALQANGILAEQDTAGEEVVVSGLYDTVSVSAGQYHYRTDGFRENDDLKDDLYDVFAQWSPTPRTSLQAEFRSRDSEFGDRMLNFYPDVFSRGLRQEPEYSLLRVGGHQQFAPGSDLIASFMYKDSNYPATVADPGVSLFETTDDERAYIAEAQYLGRARRVNVIAGGGYVSSDGTNDTSFAFDPDPTFSFSDTASIDRTHANGYAYLLVNYLRNATATVGVSYDDVRSDAAEIYDRTQWNPKLGLTWNPAAGTTLRAAAFRVLKRTLVTEQTLEPTQVAGFNQFYDEINSTDYWTYGVGVDQKFTSRLYAGLEAERRNLKVPYEFSFPDGTPGRADWTEKTASAYACWAPHDWFSLTAGYQYEKLDRGFTGNLNVAELETHRLPLAVNFFHPSGIGAGVKATWYDQKGTFLKPDAATPTPDNYAADSDRFWLVDAAVTYRLPLRHGTIVVGVQNLFDEEFKYQDTDVNNPSVQPGRTVFAKINLSL
ncbi:MAG TPA: FecR domain-containing protein [bacterium]